MTNYLRKGVKVDTSDKDYINVFEKLKELLMKDPILIHPDYSKKLILVTTASNFAMRAILMQNDDYEDYQI